MAVNKRIAFLAELTQGYDTVLDIGTDHGLVLRTAFENQYIVRAIASDLREGPLQQAKKNLKGYPVEYIQSDGFLAIDQPFDLVIIAGMGAHTITEILKPHKAEQTRFILQANDKIEFLRQFLMENHFLIVDEHYIYDKHHYIIIEAIKGEMTLSKSDLYLGPILRHKVESKDYYAYKVKQIKQIIAKVDTKRKTDLINILEIYKNV